MFVRIVSSVLALPLLIIFILLGGYWLLAACTLISLIGIYEFCKAIDGKTTPLHYVAFVAAVIYYIMIGLNSEGYILIFINIYVVVLMCIQAFFHKYVNVMQVSAIFISLFYIAATLGNIYLIRKISVPIEDSGLYYVWIVFISAWCCDTGAYFTGRLFGRHKLAPVLSPKKTVEGAVGGVLWAFIGGALYGLYIKNALRSVANSFAENGIDVIIIFAVISAVSSVFAQMGDLCASAVKRYKNIKDFGYIMPGHGGVLDRFDSVIFTSVAVYALVRLWPSMAN